MNSIKHGTDERLALILMIFSIPATVIGCILLGQDRAYLAILIGVPFFALCIFYLIIRDKLSPGRAEIYAANGAEKRARFTNWFHGDTLGARFMRAFVTVGIICLLINILIRLGQLSHLTGLIGK